VHVAKRDDFKSHAVLEFENRIVLRAGVLLLNPVDNHNPSSPFAVGGATKNSSDDASTLTVPTSGASASQTPGSAPSITNMPESKAARWAARAADKAPWPTAAVSLPAALCTPPPTVAEKHEASSAALSNADWAARVTGGGESAVSGQPSTPTTPMSIPKSSRGDDIFDRRAPSPVPPPPPVEPAPEHPASVHLAPGVAAVEPAGKASRWAARAEARKQVEELLSAADPSGFSPDASSALVYAQVRNKQVQYSGFLMNGLPAQTGEIQWANGHGYSGEFCAGKPHGKVRFHSRRAIILQGRYFICRRLSR
jgi:hypothetical protein